LLSSFALKFNLRHYTKRVELKDAVVADASPVGITLPRWGGAG